ncbi:zinc-binding alcohol dehydrogenase family protein [Methylolobus aquaticus]|nr:zinc-binding alcohol dehydrogenase family protein [Methylolobus aquaticus]
MRAMVLDRVGAMTPEGRPLALREVPEPQIGPADVLVRVSACGVCHTELDEIEGRLTPPSLPVIPGHQAVGVVAAHGIGVRDLAVGDRVGIAWIYSACGHCAHCLAGAENLCPEFRATGRDANGGYAEFIAVPAAFAHRIPPIFSDEEAAPLLCAGAIGYRSLALTGLRDGGRLGLTGFGASAHLVLMMVRHRFPNAESYVFARKPEERAFALELGAVWAGDTLDRPPVRLDAIIDTTPAWLPVVQALQNLEPGGRLVINAIRKEEADKAELTRLDYPRDLWLEREIKSVANVTRADVREFLDLAATIPMRPEVEIYDFVDANRALIDLKLKRVRGAKVLRIA